jgi:Fe-S cluster biogenesis protein NfuA
VSAVFAEENSCRESLYRPACFQPAKKTEQSRKAAGGFQMKEKVEQALAKIRPALQRDGGDVELVDVAENGLVKVRLTGACHGCPMSQMTLKAGVERIIKQQVPEVTSVVAV